MRILFTIFAICFTTFARADSLDYNEGSAVHDALARLDSAISRSESDVPNVAKARRLFSSGDSIAAESMLVAILADSTSDNATIAAGATLLSEIYLSQQERSQEYVIALCRGAVAEIESGNLDSPLLLLLADALKAQGENDLARKYLDTHAEAARDGTSRYEQILPSLKEIHQERMDLDFRHRMVLYAIVGILVVVLCALAYGWSAARLSIKAREDDNRDLNTGMLSREEYIRQLLRICSSYQDANASFVKKVARHIKTGQTRELLESIESGKIAQANIDLFLQTFDSVVDSLYPEFIDELNVLIYPDQSLSHKPGEPLSTELRIVAFIRLGVDDNEQLARFLGVSRNTIYTYRNRMRSRAINRDTFKKDLENLRFKDSDLVEG